MQYSSDSIPELPFLPICKWELVQELVIQDLKYVFFNEHFKFSSTELTLSGISGIQINSVSAVPINIKS